ncbi:MAG: hypothetical protein A2849_03455 [Candidatus Taylorbacteria bacterium RIFCSPHIGHO2_01_FULL_51_15]|uniref:Uncharacterized protein n=1 Tax=Candidatus Taylorbacteria bacterium RIFCSPHIGHO2_01_FULL_51_15 TaxID=1802304 RepID=A0A1G2MAA1_9BACT|nr:MAG: hypothetical protein A2849_03455 [Candidatus Taylorbacteria bacterium RIFCSPHIGHO2_01_FULL_51_15]
MKDSKQTEGVPGPENFEESLARWVGSLQRRDQIGLLEFVKTLDRMVSDDVSLGDAWNSIQKLKGNPNYEHLFKEDATNFGLQHLQNIVGREGITDIKLSRAQKIIQETVTGVKQ